MTHQISLINLSESYHIVKSCTRPVYQTDVTSKAFFIVLDKQAIRSSVYISGF